jgi:hypothetical protein
MLTDKKKSWFIFSPAKSNLYYVLMCVCDTDVVQRWKESNVSYYYYYYDSCFGADSSEAFNLNSYHGQFVRIITYNKFLLFGTYVWCT